ncbi:MAG: hypothetical protein AB7N24_11370 [Dehalococcoidia bacterium]
MGRVLASSVAGIFAIAGAVLLGLSSPDQVFACSGPPAHWQVAHSDVVLAGRIVAAQEDTSSTDRIYRHFEILIDVTGGIRGVSNGDRIEATAEVPRDVPVMCPQFARDETFLGKFIVAGLGPGDPASLYQWGTLYMGLDSTGSEYADALRVARMVTGTLKTGPQMTATIVGNSCGALTTLRGTGFQPGQQLILSYPVEPDANGHFTRPETHADATGNFQVQFRLPSDWCPIDWFAEAYSWRDDGQTGGWPLAVAPLVAMAPLPPDAGNTPERPTAGDDGESNFAGIVLLGTSTLVLGMLRHRARPSLD